MTSLMSMDVCEYIQHVGNVTLAKSAQILNPGRKNVSHCRQGGVCVNEYSGGAKDNLNNIWVGEAASHTLFSHVWRHMQFGDVRNSDCV
jgi:hypothetical protein